MSAVSHPASAAAISHRHPPCYRLVVNAQRDGSDEFPPVDSSAPVPVQLPIASAPEIRSLLAIAVTAIVVAALYVAQDVLIPITLAVILSFVLSPLVNLLGRVGLWRGPAVLVSVLVALGVIGLVGMLIGNQAATLAVEAPAYAETIQRKAQGVQEYAAVHFAALTSLLPGSARSGRPAASPARAPSAAGDRYPRRSNRLRCSSKLRDHVRRPLPSPGPT